MSIYLPASSYPLEGSTWYKAHTGRHTFRYELFNMGDGVYKQCEVCGYIPKRWNKEFWDFQNSGVISCLNFYVWVDR